MTEQAYENFLKRDLLYNREMFTSLNKPADVMFSTVLPEQQKWHSLNYTVVIKSLHTLVMIVQHTSPTTLKHKK